MENLNQKMQIINSTHQHLLWGKFPIQEQTCWLWHQFSHFLMYESPISKYEIRVLTESTKQCSQFARKIWKGLFSCLYMGEIYTEGSRAGTQQGVRRIQLDSSDSNAVLDFNPILLHDLRQLSLPSNRIHVWFSEALTNDKLALLKQHSKLQSHCGCQTIHTVPHVIQFWT